ncbi:MarR family winged helix-turn-helix transcriptional regulator [Streptomyces olivochromogenes]|uniref:MarR family winged helix-turn-helix transcriptional regulator n=1 Tax=Streptomyces olivochromogenes TaxID=1963 RepID=UPI001F2DBC22|nr:MarR family transcriptional regulator [Streptomyces olivochromogenes]MCF3130378.1 MarR family transcriptional regulator [Streptomyces olivochromogenes]
MNAPDQLTAEVIALFAKITALYSREYETASAHHGLTPQQVKVLLTLDEALPMRRIAERLGADPSNFTGMVDRLQSRGLVERVPDPTDRRIKRIAATEAGKAAAQDLRERLRFATDPLVALDGDQRRDLRDLLQLMVDSQRPGG